MKVNAFVLGEKQVDQLGVRKAVVKIQVIVLATMLVDAVVAVSEIIGFVGLLVPHLVRLLGRSCILYRSHIDLSVSLLLKG